MFRKYMFLITVVLVAACGQPTAATPPAAGAGDLTPLVIVSELTVGANRMALGIVQDGSPVNDPAAKIHLKFYDRADTSAAVKTEADAAYFGQGLPAAVYVAYPTFDRAGEWDVVVETQLSGAAKPVSKRLRIEVLETTTTPNIGQAAIAVKTPTIADTPVEQLSSGANPNPALYQISLDAAFESGKPTVALFATPGYCRTAMCGPNVKVLGELQETFGQQMNFIHVEIYKFPFDASFTAQADAYNAAVKDNRAMTEEEQAAGFSQGMRAWNLATEPWLFLIDKNGVIQERFEGGITIEELTPKLAAL